ncbi:unnamed protein product [Rhizopus microsporus]|uniref:Uncharacterized protein n=2 Tax=Rhizopus microsporus TaxID=58291 RepID=A0A1X0S5C1_RHIZD|nr:hypothetical protein BCV72DRAFT_269711 [Rhizopus microsporus var. microsporus]ORE19464.1 hypothetical protein BCV71DRAFT_101399 [Rhizopus microsporus]
MDLSWCIMCDQHCIEDNLYCSESCRQKDESSKIESKNRLCSPPASPLLEPFLSSFNHERRTSSKSIISISNIPKYSLSPP